MHVLTWPHKPSEEATQAAPSPGVTSPFRQRSPVLLIWGSECCDTLCCAMAQRSQDRVTPLGLASAEPRAIAVDEPSRHHRLLILRKHRRELHREGNSLGIFPTSSGTHRNIPRSPRSDSGKNNCRNVISWNTVKSCTSRGKCYVTVWNIPRLHNNTLKFSPELRNRWRFR